MDVSKKESSKVSPHSWVAGFFRGNIAVIAGSTAVNGFGTALVSTYIAKYFVGIGGDPFELGMMTSLSAIIQLFVFFVGGRIADHYGRRRVIVLAAFYAVLFPVLYVLIRDWRIFLVASVMGAFGSLSSPAIHATVADSIAPEKRTTGICTLQVLSSSPTIASPLIAGYLIEIYGLQSGFRLACLSAAATALASALILTLFLRETKQKANIEDPSAVSNTFSVKNHTGLSQESWKTSVSALLFSYGLVAFANALVGSYYILYATNVIGLGELQWGIIVSLQIAVVTLLKIPGGWASDRFGKKKVMIISILTCIPCVVIFTFSRSFLQAAVAVIMLTVAGMYYAPSHEALQADLTPRKIRGRITSFWDISSAAATSIGAPLGGFIFQTVSPAVPFYLFAVVELAAALLILIAVKEPKRAED